ncbi:hypothetical protein D3C76_1156800 [compost metagenome]
MVNAIGFVYIGIPGVQSVKFCSGGIPCLVGRPEIVVEVGIFLDQFYDSIMHSLSGYRMRCPSPHHMASRVGEVNRIVRAICICVNAAVFEGRQIVR